jgi:hypothetical protein
MFDPSSRYYALENATHTVTESDGTQRTLVYKRRRFLPSGEGLAPLAGHNVAEGDRLDNITARYLGDPTLFWHLCDANRVLRPRDLTDEIGQTIRVVVPNV